MEGTATTVCEDETVLRHRMVCFLLLGYSVEIAELLASSTLDWHEVEDLLQRGCPRDLAVRILV